MKIGTTICEHGAPTDSKCEICSLPIVKPKTEDKMGNREWWLYDVMTQDHGEILVAFQHHKNIKGSIHVVPYSALQKALDEIEELKRNLNHQVYCLDKATQDRTKAENERDAALAKVEKLRVALERECCCPGETNWTTGEDILCDPCEALRDTEA